MNYVECFPNGFRKGTKMIKACADAKLEGFPTWVINGQVWIFKCIELSLVLDQSSISGLFFSEFTLLVVA